MEQRQSAGAQEQRARQPWRGVAAEAAQQALRSPHSCQSVTVSAPATHSVLGSAPWTTPAPTPAVHCATHNSRAPGPPPLRQLQPRPISPRFGLTLAHYLGQQLGIGLAMLAIRLGFLYRSRLRYRCSLGDSISCGRSRHGLPDPLQRHPCCLLALHARCRVVQLEKIDQLSDAACLLAPLLRKTVTSSRQLRWTTLMLAEA